MGNANRLSFNPEAASTGSGDSDNEGAWGGEENISAQWVLMKERAATLDPDLPDEEQMAMSASAEMRRNMEGMDEAERARLRNIGLKIMRVINRMPDRLPMDEKAAKLERMSRLSHNLGVGADFDDMVDVEAHGGGYEQVGTETFGYGEIQLTPEEEARAEALREKVIDLTETEPGALADKFPSRNYLFHGSDIRRLERIFATGGLKNGMALAEDDPESGALSRNSGYEGISWSMDAIDALPGTRGHIAGFLAAPEDVLSGDEKLVVPSRPAPFEVLQVSEKVDADEFYRTKIQFETWGGGASLGEQNTVDSNIMFMHMDLLNANPDGRSSVFNYDGDTSAEAMRKHFSFDEQGKVVWNPDLFQKMEVPPALPYMQSLIDAGWLERSGFPELDTVDKVREKARGDDEFVITMLATARADAELVHDAYMQMIDNDVSGVRIPPERMYFVTSHKDLDNWLKVMARTGVEPKGILLYDDAQVVVEDFAGKYGGNQAELSATLGRAIGVDGEFWSREMEMKPLEMTRSGSVGQVLLESEVRHDRELKMEDGELKVVDVAEKAAGSE